MRNGGNVIGEKRLSRSDFREKKEDVEGGGRHLQRQASTSEECYREGHGRKGLCTCSYLPDETYENNQLLLVDSRRWAGLRGKCGRKGKPCL